MGRQDNRSWPLRGVPRALLDALDTRAERDGVTTNTLVLRVIKAYADQLLTPTAAPPAFDATRRPAEPYGPDTAELAISGVPTDVFAGFMDRSKRDGWLSKNALLVTLLQDFVAAP